jgi:hypothetical protein
MLVEPTMTFRRLAIALVAALVLSLSACGFADPGPDGRASIRLLPDSVDIAVCSDIDIRKGSVDYKSEGEWHSAWDFTGEVHMAAGEQFTVPGNGELTIHDGEGRFPSLVEGDSVEVFLTNEGSGQYQQIWANYLLTSEAIVSGDWINSDGTYSAEPCG